jgi:diguanylate cyclase (GGDEF)-like protein
MPRDRRCQLALGLALGSSLAFLAFLLARPVGEDGVRLVANLAQLLAPTLAAASCAWAAVTESGRTRRAWALLAGSCASWAVGQATWVWYEHLARRELPFPSLADVKTVNDQLGHAAGDDLLVAVASRLKTCVRGEDTVARLGGDEFAILLEKAPATRSRSGSPAASSKPCARPSPSRAATSRSASVGVTVSDATEVDAVLREADVAMYTAKARGKGRYELAATSASA